MKSELISSVLRRSSATLATLALAAIITPAHAAPLELVQNGGFETLTNPGLGSAEIGTQGSGQNVTGWTSTGYNFVFTPGTVDTTGSNPVGLTLWGPNNGGAAGNTLGASPDGGNFIAMDGAYQIGPLSQTITGLTAGQTYTVSFYWAGAQQHGYTGATTEQFEVGFGSQTQDTGVLDNVSQGFTGWQEDSFTFTADGSSDVLSFLAIGTPNGVPPFSLLDGVSVVAATPEPSSLALLATGFFGVGGLLRSRFKKDSI
jgi:hypothetical protein